MGTIKSDNIQARTDADGVLIKSYKETNQSLSSTSGAIAIDLANGNCGSITLTENITAINFTNVPTSGVANFTLKITQHASSAKTVTITSAVSVNGGTAATPKTSGAGGFTMTTTFSREDILTFLFFDAGTPLLSSLQDFA